MKNPLCIRRLYEPGEKDVHLSEIEFIRSFRLDILDTNKIKIETVWAEFKAEAVFNEYWLLNTDDIFFTFKGPIAIWGFRLSDFASGSCITGPFTHAPLILEGERKGWFGKRLEADSFMIPKGNLKIGVEFDEEEPVLKKPLFEPTAGEGE